MARESKRRIEDDEEEHAPDESPPTKRQALEEEEEYDDDDEEEEEEEEEEEDDRANTVSRRAVNAEGRPPEAGVIKQIQVENFMCHRKYTVELSRNVNFITGQNGSGKSAILAAIQICLGASARRTHRARNLKDLIRKDGTGVMPPNAKIRVTLLNGGEDAFKADVYGKTVTVERTIARQGGFNGYKLLDENMQEQSRSKHDLEAMLDQLNIQVENPVAVLDQEEAKKFLTGKPEDKYKFFMKATELSRISNVCGSTQDKIEELKDSHDAIANSLDAKKKQVQELKKKHEEHKALEVLNTKQTEANVLYAWAHHVKTAREHQEAADILESYKIKLEKKEQEVTELQKSVENPDDEEQIRNGKVVELLEEANTQEQRKQELENKYRDLLKPQKVLERRQRDLRKDRKTAEKNLTTAKRRLEEERNKILEKAGAQESEEAARATLLKETEERISQLKEKVNPLKQALASSHRAYEELEPHVADARATASNVENKLNAMKSKVRDLESSSGDDTAILGHRVKAVCRMVEDAKKKRKFQGPVVGPLARYIKIAPGKEEYGAIAELAIGTGMLDRFVVTNSHDREAFQAIRLAARCQNECGVLQVGNNPRYRVPSLQVEGVETAMSVFSIENDLVFNCLVDVSHIDQKALGRSRESTEERLLYKNEKGEDAVRGNITQVYFFPRGDSWQVRNGSKAVFSNEKQMRKTIGVDRSAAIRELKAEIGQTGGELREARSEEARLEQQHGTHQREWNKAKRDLQKIEKEIEEKTNLVEDTRAEIETSANVTIDTTEYEQDVAQLEQEIDENEREDEQLESEIESHQPEIDSIKASIEECAARCEKVMADVAVANESLTQLLNAKNHMKSTLEKKTAKLQQYRDAISESQKKADAIEEEKKGLLRHARQLSHNLEVHKRHCNDRESLTSTQDLQEATEEDLEAIDIVEPPKEPSFYEAKLKKYQQKIEREKDRRKVSREDPEVVLQKYLRAREDFQNKKDSLQELKETIENLDSDIDKRKVMWKKMRKHLCRTTKMKFDELLHLNKYSGTLEFDDKEMTLDLAVNKGVTNNVAARADVKALSGGERSYTTMCLLLALGEKLETPFRILDEFDVFLDAATRRLAIQMLIHLAKKAMAHRQFIFITPQDLSFVNPDDKLKVLKIQPPERRTTVGGPSQQILDFSQTG